MNIGNGSSRQIRVKISSFDLMSGLGIFVYEILDDKVYIARPGPDGRLVFHLAGKTFEHFEALPTFSVPEEIAVDFKKGMMAALHDFGVDIPSESKIAGKLEATEKHLDDMRSLVFKRKPAK